MIYDFNYSLISIIDFLSLIQGLVIGVILIIINNKKRPSLLLGLFIISFTFEVLDVFLEEIGFIDQHPSLIFLPINFYFLSIPLLYLYTKKIIKGVSIKESLLILSPGILEFFIVLILFIFPSSDKLKLLDTSFIQAFIEIYDYSSILFSIFFAILIINFIQKHKNEVESYYSNLKWKNLNWILLISSYILVQYILILFFSFFPLYDSEFSFVCSIINLIIIYWVGISGLLQLKIENSINNNEEIQVYDIANENTTLIGSVKYDETFSRLIALIKDKELYKNHDLTIAILAQQSGISKRSLSQIISKNTHSNFNRFINEFRLEEAKKLLISPSYNRFSIQGIAFESGFKSKATFYAVFKKVVGITPKAYKQQLL